MSEQSVSSAALEYINLGWRVIPLAPREKRPANFNWSTHVIEPDEVPLNFTDNSNIGALLNNGLIDIDLEINRVTQAAAWFLPPTGLVFGRNSKPRSHYLYLTDEKVRRVRYVDPITTTLMMEIRGDSHQTMLPPSIHPEGELVRWDTKKEIGNHPFPKIRLAVGFTAAAAFLSEHWDKWKDNHHDLVLHLSGGLVRAGVPEVETENLIKAICALAGDHEPNDRLEAMKSSYRRHENGESITGWPSLVDIMDNNIVSTLTSWLNITSGADGFGLSDEGNVDRLIFHFSNNLRFCPGTSQWLIWKDTHWHPSSEIEATHFAHETILRIREEAAHESDPERRIAIWKWAHTSESVGHVLAIPRLARSRSDLWISVNMLDRDPLLFNCMNGTINLATGGLQPHDRNDYITVVAPVRYYPNSEAPLWKEFLDKFQPDPNTQYFLQQAAGCCMTGKNPRKFFVHYGVGMNGKTTFTKVITGILGDYARPVDVTSFLATDSDRVRQDIARLHGARFCPCGEPEANRKLASGLIKTIVGGDPITARYLYGREFSFVASFKIWMMTNHKLQVQATDRAIWDRMMFVPWKQTQDFRTMIPLYDQILLKEEASGILNWMVQGAQSFLRKERLDSVPEVEEATSEYQKSMDTVSRFLDEECEITRHAEDKVPSQSLYNAYSEWCRDNGERAHPRSLFDSTLVAAGIEKQRNSRGLFWIGVLWNTIPTMVTVEDATGNPFS